MHLNTLVTSFKNRLVTNSHAERSEKRSVSIHYLIAERWVSHRLLINHCDPRRDTQYQKPVFTTLYQEKQLQL